MLCFRLVRLELSSPSLSITKTLATRSLSGYAASFQHADDTASKSAVPPPFVSFSIPFPNSPESELKSWVTVVSTAKPATYPRSEVLFRILSTNLAAARFSKENRSRTEPLVSTTRASRKGSLDCEVNCSTFSGGLLLSRMWMSDGSKSFTACPWLLTAKNTATSSTFLRTVHGRMARLEKPGATCDAAPLLPPLGSQSSQVPPSDSSPTALSSACNRSVSAKVCDPCDGWGLLASAACTVLLWIRAARSWRAKGANALVGSSLRKTPSSRSIASRSFKAIAADAAT